MNWFKEKRTKKIHKKWNYHPGFSNRSIPNPPAWRKRIHYNNLSPKLTPTNLLQIKWYVFFANRPGHSLHLERKRVSNVKLIIKFHESLPIWKTNRFFSNRSFTDPHLIGYLRHTQLTLSRLQNSTINALSGGLIS